MDELALRRKIVIMLALVASIMFASLNQTTLGTALPRIVAEIGGMDQYSWVLSAFMLASTVSGALIGKLSDIFGRKPFLVAGLLLFMTGCLLCGLSSSIEELIAFRTLQGFGGGIIMASSLTAVGDLFTPRERGRWQGIIGSAFAISSIAGPALGGYIVEVADWHWVFWVFLPLGLAALGLIWWLFPSVPRRRRESIDYAGMAFLTVFVVALLITLSRVGGETPLRSPFVLAALGIAVLALVLFLRTETRVPHPMLPLGLFRNPSFVLPNLTILAAQFAMFGVIMYLPLYVQVVLGLAASVSGYVTSPLMIAMVCASSVSGQIVTRTGKYKKQAVLGMAAMCAGMFLLSRLGPDAPVAEVIAFIVISGLGMGTVVPILNVTVQNAVPDRLLGVATSTMQLFRQFGGTIGVTVAGSYITASTASGMRALAERHGLDPAIAAEWSDPQLLVDRDRLRELAAEAAASPGGDAGTAAAELAAALPGALSDAIGGAFAIGFGFGLVSLVLVAGLKEVPLRSYRTRDEEEPPGGVPGPGRNVPASGG